MKLTPAESERFQRHLLLKEVGGVGQQKLKSARVVIVGLGGLGGPAALYLAAAGVGTLRLIDHDRVSLSNLQRQIQFREADVGQHKVSAAARALGAMNAAVVLEPQDQRIEAANALPLLRGADIVLDGTDDFATRFTVNDACRALSVPLVSGAVGRWDGQVAVFAPGGPCYRCLVPETPPDAEPCSTQGVVGALTGVIGAMMALETIKLITGAGKPLAGRLLLYDGLSATTRVAGLPRDADCPACGLPSPAESA